MKWIRRILIAIVLIIVLLIVGVFGIIAVDSVAGDVATNYTNVSYPADDGTTLNAYMATPTGEGPFPAVLMVHEWWGLNGEITEMADRLAEEGYVVLAPDTYRGPTTRQIPRAVFLRVTIPEERVDQDMLAAFAYLASRDDVDVDNIGVIGFCYGGGVALRHAVLNPDIAATANLYGDTILDPADFGALLDADAGPVLGVFGTADMQIPVEEVEQFEQALAEADIEHTVNLYQDMPHAFIQPDNIDEPGQPQTAWEDIKAFFAAHLQAADAEPGA
ncbi:MAG: dienelactone hydrolase [Anaerolineaceae bacterium]|nr:dienelactone hydrolase [Anaerolineaceae bacterium]